MRSAPQTLAGSQARYYGLWQVHGRSRTTFDEMVRLDLRSRECGSPISDLKILLTDSQSCIFGRRRILTKPTPRSLFYVSSTLHTSGCSQPPPVDA